MKLRLAVVGTGMMARMRTRAFLSTGEVVVVGVASKQDSHATAFADHYGCKYSTSDYTHLEACKPDVLLIELPHCKQPEIVAWGLKLGIHMLVGSCMAMDREEINRICQLSEAKHLVVEGGFEARYKAVWKHTKTLIHSGEIGETCGLQATACWNAMPRSWYYSQEKSGGMPITHMTYAFLNPLTWIFGTPVSLSAIANQKGIQLPGMVKEVSCAVNIQYEQNVPCQLFASYVAHKGAPNWKIFIQGTMGALEVFPEEFGNGKIWHYGKDDEPVCIDFEDAEDPFETQARLFIQAILNKDSGLLNTPQMCINDVRMVSAIHESLKGNHTFHFKNDFAPI